MPITKVTPAELRLTVDPAALGFADTSELLHHPLPWIGQERAEQAARFGLAMDQPDYNLFVLGEVGSGRSTLLCQMMHEVAATRPVPPDLCYLHNFDAPEHPRALRMPPGQGRQLRALMQQLVKTLQAETDRASARIEQLKKQIGEVEKFKARKAELQKKVDIISNLQTARTGPVRVLDALAAAVPAKCWIDQLAYKGSRIELTGMAINNDTIANFMTALQQSGTFKDVALGSADQATVLNTKLMKFNLTFSVVPK